MVSSPHDDERHAGRDATVLLDVFEHEDAFEHLCKEAFEKAFVAHHIPASTLRQRLPHALELADRTISDSGEHTRTVRALRTFVEVAEKLEQDFGPPVAIHIG